MLGITRSYATVLRSYARAEGLIERDAPRDGLAYWKAMKIKGAAPPRGTTAALLRGLSVAETGALLDMLKREDTTLVDLLRRLVKERVNAPR